MSDEPALLKAIIAHPDEDTPRLAYADWLDEHGAPLRADFIRTQCRLASCTAADPDYPDLLERYAEVAPAVERMLKSIAPELPLRFDFDADLRPDRDYFRRGFLYTVCRHAHADYAGAPNIKKKEVDLLCNGLAPLIATTTARALYLTNMSGPQIARVLAAPGAEALTGLDVCMTTGSEAEDREAIRAVASSAVAPKLERLRLDLYRFARATALEPLVRASLDRLVHFSMPTLYGPTRGVRALAATDWFKRLRSIRVYVSDEPLGEAVVTALAKLPQLESLELESSSTEARALGSPRGFPALARLDLRLSSRTAATLLARGPYPRLTELALRSITSSEFAALRKAPWFPQLRVLSFHGGDLSDAAVVALARSPAAANLRILRFVGLGFGPEALAALGTGARFPNLTALELTRGSGRRPKGTDMGRFVKALKIPRLRHLHIDGWPLFAAGARALAANPALTNLTRLTLRRTHLGDPSLAALVRSPHLQQLITLDLEGNELKSAAALHDPQWLPHLAEVTGLHSNPISLDAQRRLFEARGWAE
jgi:uncharacterized protein (TIGR02996 family)